MKNLSLKLKRGVRRAGTGPKGEPLFTADCSVFRGHKVLGEIVKVHEVGIYYHIVEHHVPTKTPKWFHPFYDPLGGLPCVDLECDFMDMDDALLVLIAHRRKIASMGG